MDSAKYLQSSKYLASFDSLDFALLPTNYSSNYNNKTTALLWNVNNKILNKNYYLEFEIMAEPDVSIINSEPINETVVNDATDAEHETDLNISNEEQRESIEHIPVTTCNICDVKVPIAYIKDHENSLKHIAYAKIVDMVLMRIRKHMLMTQRSYKEKYNSMYYCGACNKLIQLNNKYIHEKSKEHKQCTTLDRLLNELVTLFTDGHENVTAYNETVDSINTEFNTNICNDNISISTRADYEEIETKSIENYIKLVNESDVDKCYTLSSGNVSIKIQDCEVLISIDNFNGFVHIEDNLILCLLCRITVENGMQHMLSDMHFKNVIMPMKDFLRNMGNLNHCMICNKMVPNTNNIHVSSDETHSQLLQRAINAKTKPHTNIESTFHNGYVNDSNCHSVSNRTDANRLLKAITADKSKYFNSENVNNQFHETKPLSNGKEPLADEKRSQVNETKPQVNETKPQVNETKPQVKETKPQVNETKPQVNETKPQVNETKPQVNETKPQVNETKPQVKETKPLMDTKSNANITSTNEFTTDIDNQIFHCHSCNLKIHMNNITSHLIGRKHAFNSKSKLHYTMRQEDGLNDLTCRVCNEYIADDETLIREHTTTEQHMTKYRALLQSNKIVRQKKNLYCKPCDVEILKRNEFYHIEKLTHENNLASFIEESVNTDSVADAPETSPYTCVICNVNVPNNPYNITGHNNGALHKKKLSKLGQLIDFVVKNQNVEIDARCQMESTDNDKNLTCKVCKVVVPNLDENISEHVLGKKHDTTLKNFLEANNIESFGAHYHCKKCELLISMRDLFAHVNEEKHKRLNLQAEINEIASPEPETSKQNENNDVTEEFDLIHDKNRHYFKQNCNTEVKCLICCKVIPYSVKNIVNHVMNPTHVRELKNWMLFNQIYKTDEQNFYCGFCDCLVPLSGEYHHVEGSRHKNSNMKANKIRCDVCNINIDFDHIMSKEHTINILKNQTLLHYCEFCEKIVKKEKAQEHSSCFSKLNPSAAL